MDSYRVRQPEKDWRGGEGGAGGRTAPRPKSGKDRRFSRGSGAGVKASVGGETLGKHGSFLSGVLRCGWGTLEI